jgi:hypothetical protein
MKNNCGIALGCVDFFKKNKSTGAAFFSLGFRMLGY